MAERKGYTSSATITRTADVNAYLAGDIVGAATGATAAVEFIGFGSAQRDMRITGASLQIDAAAIISGETSYILYLYNVTPPSALGDNAPWDLPSGDRGSFLGAIALGTPADLGSTLFIETHTFNKRIKTKNTSVFGYLVTVGPYTPTASRVHKITLHAEAV